VQFLMELGGARLVEHCWIWRDAANSSVNSGARTALGPARLKLSASSCMRFWRSRRGFIHVPASDLRGGWLQSNLQSSRSWSSETISSFSWAAPASWETLYRCLVEPKALLCQLVGTSGVDSTASGTATMTTFRDRLIISIHDIQGG